jgi:hypothetical protein
MKIEENTEDKLKITEAVGQLFGELSMVNCEYVHLLIIDY